MKMFIRLLSWLALIGMTLSAFQAQAGKVSGTSSIRMVMLNDHNSDGLPNLGDVVTFEYTSTAYPYTPWVELRCYQNSVLVAASKGLLCGTDCGTYPWPWDQFFILGPTTWWTSGAADCVANLGYDGRRRFVVLATLNFHVGP